MTAAELCVRCHVVRRVERPVVWADMCRECAVLAVTDDTACYSCGVPGIVAHMGRLFHIREQWHEYRRAVEDANGMTRGTLDCVRPLVAPLNDGDADLLCRDCVSFCDDCGEPWYGDADADTCCGSRCDECGEQWDTTAEAERCCSLIHEYHYTPELWFYESRPVAPHVDGTGTGRYGHARPGVLFMGVELETEYAAEHMDDWYRDAHESFDTPRFVYAKHDGSLGSGGVEFVSMPATLDAFREMWPWDAFAKLNAAGARSWFADCGLHVHVARTAFVDALHMARFVLLQYRNRDDFVALAGRDCEQWASWDTTELLERGALPEYVKGKRENGQRYRALNFQNHATVELRYFRGNLRRAGLLRVVETVAAAHEYTRDMTTADALRGALDWRRFALMIRTERQRYPYAAHWAATRLKGN